MSRPPRPRTAVRPPPHQLRIIGGQWRRTKLPVPAVPGLRPTPDRVRETLFNWLGQDLRGWRCVDAFSGSGALGLEAASRGAGEVLLVERDARLVASLRATKERLDADVVQVRHGDGLIALGEQPSASVDLIFLDPPFAEEALFTPALEAAARVVRPGGFIYLEAPRLWSVDALSVLGLGLHRHLAAGAVHAHLLVLLPPSSA